MERLRAPEKKKPMTAAQGFVARAAKVVNPKQAVRREQFDLFSDEDNQLSPVRSHKPTPTNFNQRNK
jgi:hypothetical protein